MTRMMALVVLAVSLASVTASQLILKVRMGPLSALLHMGQPWTAVLMRALADPYMWLGGACVAVGGACWYLAMTKLPLSLMLPVSSVIAPCASIGAYYFLGENLSLAKVSAIIVIMVGVSWLGWLNA